MGPQGKQWLDKPDYMGCRVQRQGHRPLSYLSEVSAAVITLSAGSETWSARSNSAQYIATSFWACKSSILALDLRRNGFTMYACSWVCSIATETSRLLSVTPPLHLSHSKLHREH